MGGVAGWSLAPTSHRSGADRGVPPAGRFRPLAAAALTPRHHGWVSTLLGLDLRGRRVVVVGGGPSAAAHALRLQDDGAAVVVVAPFACEDLHLLAHERGVDLLLREPVPADLDGAWLAVAATDSATEDERVRGWADERRLWCVGGDATPAATSDAAGLTVGVLPDGGPDGPARAHRLLDDLALAVDSGAADLRRPGAGHVTLVGGGPGAPELITVAGRRALAAADVVVTDRLGPRSVLAQLRPGVEVIDVGKTPGHHPVPQHEINRILVEQAQRGRRVVRLKGGDPFLLGRGGEEVAACREAGVRVDVVPGITSAFSVPALAGIPVTQREVAAAVHVTSGHQRLEDAALASVRDASATLVVLMGVGNLGSIVEQLLGAGADRAVPAAIVERGSTPEQRVTQASLDEIVAVAAQAQVRAPAVIVVGAVADPALLDAAPA